MNGRFRSMNGCELTKRGGTDRASRTAWITDPDGNRIELVRWPPGHPDALTAADWPEEG